MARKVVLFCGISSSVLYVVMNTVGAMRYAGYSSVSQTVSELSAIGAPTRPLWVLLGVAYSFLVIAFGWAVWRSAGQNRSLRIAGGLIMIGYAVTGLAWPFAPMHTREVLAAGGGTLSDTMHIVLAVVSVLLMMATLGFGRAAFGKRFRSYTTMTVLILVAFGVLTFLDGPRIGTNLPTPWIGVWERINIGVFLLWVVVLAIAVFRIPCPAAVTVRRLVTHTRTSPHPMPTRSPKRSAATIVRP